MNIKISTQKEKTTLILSGSIDASGADNLKKHFSEILENDSVKEVCLDFEEVGFIGSSGIGRLLLFYKSFSSKGGKVQIVNLNQEMSALFKTLNLGKLFYLLRLRING